MASIRKRGEGIYQFIVSLGKNSKGQYRREFKTYRVTEKFTPKKLQEHLENEAYKFEMEVKSNLYIKPESMSFGKFLDEWKKKYLEVELKENTIALRLGSITNHVAPILNHLEMDKITTMMLLDIMNNLTRKDGRAGDLSISAKQEVYKGLASIFKCAENWNVIKENPMNGVNYPKDMKKGFKKELETFDEGEIKLLLDALNNEPMHWRIFITLAFTTGLRRGELLGLEWKHIDLNNGIIHVRQIISKTRKGSAISEPKFNSVRDVSISESLINDLKEFKDKSLEELSNLGINDRNNDWVFFNEYGEHFYPDTPTTWWRRFIKRSGIRLIRLHDLRHTSATILISKNVHAKIISERLGHKKISTTMDIYGHVLPSADKEAGNKFEEILNG